MQINSYYNIKIPQYQTNFKSAQRTDVQANDGEKNNKTTNPFDKYLDSQAAVNAAGIKKITPVDDKKTTPVDYHNNLRSMIQDNDAIIMAIIPRMLGAKDLNGDRRINPKLGEKPGTFLSCIEKLDDFQNLGINTLHVLPIHPPGKNHAMGTAGSVYAPLKFVEDNGDLAIDPVLVDFSDPRSPKEQFKAFIDACHERGIRVMLDLPSCASLDMSNNEQALMARGRHGEDKCPQGWVDIRMFDPWADETKRQLNPKLLEMHKQFVDSCIELGIDGIRADVARAKPTEFWDILINYSHEKDPEFAWLAETYTYECASPQLNMMHDRPIDSLRAGFDCYYGQYHMFHEMKAGEFIDYVTMNLDLTNRDYEGDGIKELAGKSLIGSFTTHDDMSAMVRGGEIFSDLSTIIQSTIPMTNPYYVDGFQYGDYYDYPYAGKEDIETQTDSYINKVHHNKLDLFNFSAPAEGKCHDIGRVMKETNKMRQKYNDIITKGSFVELYKEGDKGDWVIPYARTLNGKTLVVIANKNVNRPISVKVFVPGIKEGQILKNEAPSYGEESEIQTAENEIRAILAPAKAYVFEVDTPELEDYYQDFIYKQNFDKGELIQEANDTDEEIDDNTITENDETVE